MAASVARVRGAHASARLTSLSRLRSVWSVFQTAYEPCVRRCSWMSQLAHRWQAPSSGEDAPSPRMAFREELKPSGLPTALLRVVTEVETSPSAFAPHLWEDVPPPLLPRTKHALERFLGRLRQSRRHSTGRTHTPALMRRDGSRVALRFGLPHPDHWGAAFARVNPHDFHRTLHRLRQPEKRRQCGRVRRAGGA